MYVFWCVAASYSIGVFWGMRIIEGSSPIERIAGIVIVAILLFIIAVSLNKHRRGY